MAVASSAPLRKAAALPWYRHPGPPLPQTGPNSLTGWVPRLFAYLRASWRIGMRSTSQPATWDAPKCAGSYDAGIARWPKAEGTEEYAHSFATTGTPVMRPETSAAQEPVGASCGGTPRVRPSTVELGQVERYPGWVVVAAVAAVARAPVDEGGRLLLCERRAEPDLVEQFVACGLA